MLLVHRLRLIITFAALIAGALISGCASTGGHQLKGEGMASTNNRKIIPIAGMDGSDRILQELVKDVLKEHGIWSSREGSVLYDILVYQEDAEKATQILATDPRLVGKRIRPLPPR